jgi:predicted DNA-binding protein
MGRPLKASSPLLYEVKARLDKEGFDNLNNYCRKNSQERAAVIRDAIKEYIRK